MTATSLDRRAVLALLAAAAFARSAQAADAPAPGLSAEDQALVDRATRYLQGLTGAKGRFVQTDPRGATSQGDLYLQRPGRARFAYDPPSGVTVVADGTSVLIADTRLKTFQSYPLGTTPLALFLARDIRFDRSVRITQVKRLAGGFSVTAEDASHANRGRITLDFGDDPLHLLGWTIVDAARAATQVRLTSLTPASGLDKALFRLADPRPQRTGRP